MEELLSQVCEFTVFSLIEKLKYQAVQEVTLGYFKLNVMRGPI